MLPQLLVGSAHRENLVERDGKDRDSSPSNLEILHQLPGVVKPWAALESDDRPRDLLLALFGPRVDIHESMEYRSRREQHA
jgi:hypothetical protein